MDFAGFAQQALRTLHGVDYLRDGESKSEVQEKTEVKVTTDRPTMPNIPSKSFPTSLQSHHWAKVQ